MELIEDGMSHEDVAKKFDLSVPYITFIIRENRP